MELLEAIQCVSPGTMNGIISGKPLYTGFETLLAEWRQWSNEPKWRLSVIDDRIVCLWQRCGLNVKVIRAADLETGHIFDSASDTPVMYEQDGSSHDWLAARGVRILYGYFYPADAPAVQSYDRQVALSL